MATERNGNVNFGGSTIEEAAIAYFFAFVLQTGSLCRLLHVTALAHMIESDVSLRSN